MGRSTGDTSPVQWCRKRRFSCPCLRGSKRQEATATPWTSSAAPEGRICTHPPSHDTLCPLLPSMFCTKGKPEPASEGSATNKYGISVKADRDLLTTLISCCRVKTSRGLRMHTTPALSHARKPVALRAFGSSWLFFSLSIWDWLFLKTSKKLTKGTPSLFPQLFAKYLFFQTIIKICSAGIFASGIQRSCRGRNKLKEIRM